MPTRLMLIRDSAPMPGARVKIKGLSGDFHSDDDGMVEVPVETETFSVAVHDTQDWIVKKVRRTTPGTMVVVDLSERDEAPRKRWDLSDRYTFQQVLGRGGMGVVVRATDNLLERSVAIKMLSDEFIENDEAQQLFMTEGRAMATLSHPNLVTVHDVTKAGGRVLMVLEFIDGQNVEEVLKERQVFSVSEALSITIQVLKALEYLHTQGVIHRDLKPGNFMINEAGTVKVIDFGLARSLEDLYDKGTRVRGTPAYMAPEQIRGEKMSGATDIYQMGVSLWELLTGELPYSGEQLYAHVHEKVPRIRDLDKTMDHELDELLWECLQKEPGLRPQSSTVLRAQLEAIYYRIATDPNLGTAPTAHLVEAGLANQARKTEALAPNVPADLGTHPSGSMLSKAPSASSDELDSDAVKQSRTPLLILIALLILGGGGIAAYSAGLFETPTPDRAASLNAAVAESAPSPSETTETVTPRAVPTDSDPGVALSLAQETITSGISASRSGASMATDSIEREQEVPAKSARTPKSTREKSPKKSPADDSPTAPTDSAESAESAETFGTAAKEPTSEEADEPKPFKPTTFAPVTVKQPDEKKADKKKADEPDPKPTVKTKPKPDKKEEETKNEVPVSF